MSANSTNVDGLPSSQSTELDSSPGLFSVSLWHNVTIVCWPMPACEESVRRVEAATTTLLSGGLTSFSNLHLVQESSGMPTDRARAGLVEMAERYAPALSCIGVALLGSGFWASARQSAVTGMRMQSPRSVAFRVERSLEAIAEWLPAEHVARTGVPIDGRELLATMTQALERTMQAARRAEATPTHQSIPSERPSG